MKTPASDGVSYRKALRIHDQFTSRKSLARNLFDGYLLAHNPVFRNIRREANRLGYRFTTQVDHAYQALSLSQLTRILRTRKIPYVDNVTVLREVAATPAARLSVYLVAPKANHVFHEAAHCVISKALSRHLRGRSRIATLNRRRGAVFRMLLEESFANACEAFGWIDAETSMHQLAYGLNAYPQMDRGITGDRARDVLSLLGRKRALAVLFFGFVYSNLLAKALPLKNLNRFLALDPEGEPLVLTARDGKRLETFLDAPFLLPISFRVMTAKFYLAMQSIPGDLLTLYDFDPIEVLESDSELSAVIWALIREVSRESRSGVRSGS